MRLERDIRMRRVFLTVEGIVQGVGFRPFIYNLASSFSLNGWVNNNSEGVYVDVEGSESSISEFIKKVKSNPPPLARIENIKVEEMPLANYSQFVIKKSEVTEEKITLISPDMATCKDCINDIHDPNNRRYRYPFTNCTNCGPRFTIIKSIPYDRDKTTMKKFKMCDECEHEYKDPTNRRFHAQPNACKSCGPELWVTDNSGNLINTDDPLKFTTEKLKEGYIFAIKGLGGFHLACDATNPRSVELLRTRKHRPYKPLAVMAGNIDAAKKYCTINEKEEELLTGIRKPIVLLNRNDNYDLPEAVAPNQKTLGVMLPYTPLHELLFSDELQLLIMTSANVYGLPLEYINESAIEKLSGIVDYFLMHNRDIYIPIDDSVVRVVDDEEMMIRRARGYAPDPIKLRECKDILACGPNMKNTFCIWREGFLFMSQHNGDLENLETIEHYKRNIEHFKNIFSFVPRYIACDLHPEYESTKYARTYDLPIIEVQHHHAHIASCMAENHLKNKVIGVSYDGTGYGTDGKIWGGEIFICDYKDFNRIAHIDYVKMAGGDKSIMEPWRMAVAYITKYKAYISNYSQEIEKLFGRNGNLLSTLIDKGINCTDTSSMGRLFDAASSIAGVRDLITYEGQASIEFEAIIHAESNDKYEYNLIKKEDKYIIDPKKIILGLLKDRLSGVSSEIMALKFHNAIINITLDVCSIARDKSGINDVALSGGVFQNVYLLKHVVKSLKAKGFNVFTQKQLPSNDGGVALGQIMIANERLK